MKSIRRPIAYGIAIAVGTVIGFVAAGGSSIQSGLMIAITAFVVMFILKFAFDR
jgi:hypothetical protein